MFKLFRTIYSRWVPWRTILLLLQFLMKSPDSLVYVRLNIEFAVAGKQKRNHRQLFFFFAAALFSLRIAINVHVLQRFAWVVHQYIESPRDNQKPGAKTNPLKTNELNFSDYSLYLQYLLNYAVNVLKNMKIWNYSLGEGILNDLFYFFWGISGFQGCDSYLRANRCIVVAEQHCEATLIGNYPGSTAKPNSDWWNKQSLTGFSPPTQSKHNKLLSL